MAWSANWVDTRSWALTARYCLATHQVTRVTSRRRHSIAGARQAVTSRRELAATVQLRRASAATVTSDLVNSDPVTFDPGQSWRRQTSLSMPMWACRRHRCHGDTSEQIDIISTALKNCSINWCYQTTDKSSYFANEIFLLLKIPRSSNNVW